MNERIYSMLGVIGASPYMAGKLRLNSQYAYIEQGIARNMPEDAVAVCKDLFEHLMGKLYESVTGEKQPISVIVSDIDFWHVVEEPTLCDMAYMLYYALFQMQTGSDNRKVGVETAMLVKESLEGLIERIASFLEEKGPEKCLHPVLLGRPEVRAGICELCSRLESGLGSAGYRDGLSIEPPYMNACLLDFPASEPIIWAGYLADQPHRTGLLAAAKVKRVSAEEMVRENVSLATELVRRAAEEANGGVLLIDEFQAFDTLCVGGSLIDRVFRTVFTQAERYRGSLCILIAGQGEGFKKAVLILINEMICLN